MEYFQLNGSKVSRIGLGTWAIGGLEWGNVSDDDGVATCLSIFDHGINLIDTAPIYGHGRAEEIVGKALRQHGKREDFYIATKAGLEWNDDGVVANSEPARLRQELEDSLRRLGTDYIDLYQLHFYDRETPIDETLGVLDDVVRSGKVRYIGCSNFLAYQLARAVGRSEVLGRARMDSVQPRYNLLFRQIERELLPLCAEEGIGVIPYNPIAGGLLTGKHRQESLAEGGRFTLGTAGRMYQDRYWHDREFATVETLRPLADKAGVSLTTLAVQWVLANPVVSSAIVGASRPEQLADSLAAAEAPLDTDLKAELDELTALYRQGDAAR
jgi:aryl-alcohol dehydrogenase-like predicted oxidoreductase